MISVVSSDPRVAAELDAGAKLVADLGSVAHGPAIVVLPQADLAAFVAHLGDRRVAAVVSAERTPPSEIAALAARAAGRPSAGLAGVLGPEAQIHQRTVGDSADKARCLRAIVELVATSPARGQLQAIEQCVDEMVTNALYDAPVDEHGAHVFAGISSRARVAMRTQHVVGVEYGLDGGRFAISVHDAFGSLAKDVVVRHLDKALHSEHAVDRKAGGAGLGLYLMASAASALTFHVVPGVATHAVCVFEHHSAPSGIAELGFFVHDPAGAPRSEPARRRLVGRVRARRAALAVVGTTVTVSGTVAIAYFATRASSARVAITTTPGAAIAVDGQPAGIASDGTLVVRDLEIGRPYRISASLDHHEPHRTIARFERGANDLALGVEPVATVALDSHPGDATVEIDGKLVGSTPCEVTSLAPGASVTVAFKHPGYRTASTHLQVPARGQRQGLVETLEPDDRFVLVRFVSTPPGAAIVRDGDRSGGGHTYTPAELYVEADQVQHFKLVMPHHAPLVIPPFTVARGTTDLEKGGELTSSDDPGNGPAR